MDFKCYLIIKISTFCKSKSQISILKYIDRIELPIVIWITTWKNQCNINIILILIIGDKNVETRATCRIALQLDREYFIPSNIEFEISISVPEKFFNRTLVKLASKEMSSVTNLGGVVKSSWTKSGKWKRTEEKGNGEGKKGHASWNKCKLYCRLTFAETEKCQEGGILKAG